MQASSGLLAPRARLEKKRRKEKWDTSASGGASGRRVATGGDGGFLDLAQNTRDGGAQR